jgi:hypothetical protein
MTEFKNPFRPGAGHQPPYLAGREQERAEFKASLSQFPVTQNFIITGLRGVGKTVLLDSLKPSAIEAGWLWAGTDMSESVSVSEENLAIRLIADLATISSLFPVEVRKTGLGFGNEIQTEKVYYTYEVLCQIYTSTPGLVADKLKVVLELVWELVKDKAKGVILAYDEAQNLTDQSAINQYPLSILLEVVQYLQKKQIPYLLVLTGLPTLFPKLVETRTYAERMFHVVTLDKLEDSQSRKAITEPIKHHKSIIAFTPDSVTAIVFYSGGYPYFIQFLCKEAFDTYHQQMKMGITTPNVTVGELMRKLDSDFYIGRWSRITDRQKALLTLTAHLGTCDDEFTVQEIESKSKESGNGFSASNINQMLARLTEMGLIYKNRHGKYSFAVPMFSAFIKRQMNNTTQY